MPGEKCMKCALATAIGNWKSGRKMAHAQRDPQKPFAILHARIFLFLYANKHYECYQLGVWVGQGVRVAL